MRRFGSVACKSRTLLLLIVLYLLAGGAQGAIGEQIFEPPHPSSYHWVKVITRSPNTVTRTAIS